MDKEKQDEKELTSSGKMSFLDHLDELRRRIIVSVASVGITFIICWVFHEVIYDFLSIPITQHLGDNKLTYLSPTEPFTIYMKSAFYAAIFLASPAVLWQVWLFISPGLYAKEKKYVFLAELEIWSLANHDEAVRSRTKKLYTNLITLFSGIIKDGVEQGEFKKLNINIAALSIMTSLQGVIWFSIFEKSDLSAEEYLTEVMEFIINGFKK